MGRRIESRWPENGHAYLFVRAENVPWPLADSEARERGGHLVTITSLKENDFVFSLLSKDIDASYVGANGPWLGAVRISTSNDAIHGWRWVTDEPFSFAAWGVGEPSDPPDGAETSISYYSSDQSFGTWADLGPDYTTSGFVVEYE